MFYVYVLLSEVDNQFYTGATSDLKSRIKQRDEGNVPSTKDRRPLQLNYTLNGKKFPRVGLSRRAGIKALTREQTRNI